MNKNENGTGKNRTDHKDTGADETSPSSARETPKNNNV